MYKFMRVAIPVAMLSLVSVLPASAQAGASVFAGVGTTVLESNGQSIDTFGDGTLFNTPRMTGAFGKFGGDFMLTPHFGIGAETDFRFSQGAYAGLNYRPLFYDFNGIWMPTAHRLKRVVPEFQAGLGAVNVKFYETQSFCNAFTGCSSQSNFVDSSNHFQVHMAAGVRFYVTDHLFVRPQVDAHYVHNFFQFGSNWVPEYGASVGWTFGER